MNGVPVLSLVVFAPFIGALVLLFVPSDNLRAIRGIAHQMRILLASLVLDFGHVEKARVLGD